MKKSFLITVLAILMPSCVLLAQSDNWIKTSDGDFDCAKIKVNRTSASITLPDGEKKTFPVSSVHSYGKKGKTFYKMPLYSNGSVKESVFMEFVKTIDGMSLYKYRDTNKSMNRYYVYKGNDYYLEIQKDLNPEFTAFFQD